MRTTNTTRTLEKIKYFGAKNEMVRSAGTLKIGPRGLNSDSTKMKINIETLIATVIHI
jgi:hypothetical protein